MKAVCLLFLTVVTFLVSMLVVNSSLFAQDRILPQDFAPWESRQFNAHEHQMQLNRSNQVFYTPPVSPARTAAEWEEIQALTITWRSFPAILAQIVDHARHEVEVIIVCNDSNAVKTYLTNYGISDFTNISYLQKPSNSIWSRDYQGHTAYLNDVDTLVLVDWIYNRPRPADDALPFEIAEYLNIPLYSTSQAPTDLVHTGGNFMSDGFGTGFSSELVYNENVAGNSYGVTAKTPAQVDNIMNSFMGIHTYVTMTPLPFDGINHIDMHMKLLDEETLLISEYPQGVSDGPQIEANIQYIQNNYTSVFGTPYKIVRVQAPPSPNGNHPPNAHYRTYTNSTFVNNTLLVPTYYESYDTTALRIIRENLPGYNVVGINCNAIIPSGGAIHCITHSIGVDDPLLISHQVLADQDASMTDYRVEARIQHRSGIFEAFLVYSTDDEIQQPFMLAMEPVPGQPNMWEAYIPQHESGEVINYYIDATANNGKQQFRPITAPEGFWSFKITGEVTSVDQALVPSFDFGAVFPNPASAITAIPLFLGTETKVEVQLADVFGRRIFSVFNGVKPGGEHTFFFNAAHLPSGMYFVNVITESGTQTQRVIVQNLN